MNAKHTEEITRETMDADLRIRVPAAVKTQLDVMARRQMLRVSDLARQAIAEFIRTKTGELP
jgi:hypothetical protein